MKYIGECAYDKSALERHGCEGEDCPHARPHNLRYSCPIGNCKCIPMDLEYYMKEAIKKHEEENGYGKKKGK